MWCGAASRPRFRAIIERPCGRSQQKGMNMTRSFAAMLVVVVATLALEAGPEAAGQAPFPALNSSSGEAVARKTESGNTVTFWNLIGINTILATPLGPRAAPLGSRAMAIMHVAMPDAVASIHPTYKPYAVRVTGHG